MRKSYKTILLLILLVASSCREQIIHNLSEKDANRLLTRLNEINIQPEKERQADGHWAISVKKGEVFEAIKYLNDTRMFREADSALNEKSSLISSREDQRFRYERALSREIEATLASIEGVLEARVHLNLPYTDPLFGQPIDGQFVGSGSVLVIAKEAFKHPSEHIAALVSGASGIAAKNISVLVNNTKAKESVALKPAINPELLAQQEKHVSSGTKITNSSTIVFVIGAVLASLLAFGTFYIRRSKQGERSFEWK